MDTTKYSNIIMVESTPSSSSSLLSDTVTPMKQTLELPQPLTRCVHYFVLIPKYINKQTLEVLLYIGIVIHGHMSKDVNKPSMIQSCLHDRGFRVRFSVSVFRVTRNVQWLGSKMGGLIQGWVYGFV